MQHLEQHKFDLVLHGHKHKAQFARLELSAGRADPYPLMVLAGGSAARRDTALADNTLRLITTEPNGLLTIETVKSGHASDDPDDVYREEITKLKQRAFSRARERAKRTCSLLHRDIKIDSLGNVSNVLRIEQLRLLRDAETVEGIPIGLVIPPMGSALMISSRLMKISRDTIKEICWRDSKGDCHPLNKIPDTRDGYCWVQFNEPLRPGGKASKPFSIRYPLANIIAMSTWEAGERARVNSKQDDNTESVWRYVSHPADMLKVRLEFPPELKNVQPRLRCRRHPDYPDFPLTFLPQAAASKFDEETFIVDQDMQDEEKRKLKYDAKEKAWVLEVDYPTPGYIYELSWDLPVLAADTPVMGATTDYQTMLLKLGRRISENKLSGSDRECLSFFKKFAQLTMKKFASKLPDERQAVFLIVYNREDLKLDPVLSFYSDGVSEPAPPISLPESFSIPLGAGVSGAGFLQRRVVAWGKSPDSRSLIRPVALPHLDAQYILAVPIFYQHEQAAGGQLDLRPGAVIGVVTLASTARGSPIEQCRGDTEPPKALT